MRKGSADIRERDLVVRAQSGDAKAADAFLRLHYDNVRAVCHRIVINPADADDATQQALISIVRALPNFDGRSKVSTWMYRIATNAAIDEVRRIRRRDIPTSHESIGDVEVGGGHSAVDAQIDVRRALETMPEEFRVAVVLRHVADLEYEDIAEVLGIPVGTVKSRITRGRTQLAAALTDSSVGNLSAPEHRQTSTREMGTP
jgi:RNA polymerase sigma-70 factor (ECF subfamily)